MMKSTHVTSAVQDQVAGSYVDLINQERITDLQNCLQRQDIAFNLASEQVSKIRDFIARPENILGSMATKHGEIAEQVEVGIRNAQQAMTETLQDSVDFRATFDGVGRTASADYLIDGVEIQSKFINGVRNNLDHVLKHLEKYPDFASDKASYHIPKDAWQTVRDIMDGNPPEELSEKTINAIRTNIEQIETVTGRPFDSVIQPGVSDYADVQPGKIDETLDSHDRVLKEQNQNRKESIVDEHQPSLHEAMRATAMGAAVGGAVALGTTIYQKYRSGKSIFKGEFTGEDWSELGVDAAKGMAIGGVSAGTIYALTNHAAMSAPFAGALVTAAKGVGSLACSLQEGEIDNDEFIDLALIVCAESAIVGAMTVAGQALIPVPILGALVGSISGKFLVSVAKNLNGKAAQALQQRMEDFNRRLSAFEQQTLDRILTEFTALGDLTSAAFNVETNCQLLTASVTLARAWGVDEHVIIKDVDDLDAFMTA